MAKIKVVVFDPMAKNTEFTLGSTTFPAGPTISPTFTIHNGVTTATIQMTILASDATDTTKNFTLELQRSDGAGGFTPDLDFTWNGSANPKAATPQVTWDIGPLQGQTCRMVITPNKSLTISSTTITTQ